MKTMKVFITGGTGFIGQALVDRLAAQGHELRLLVRNPAKSALYLRAGIVLCQGDLHDISSLHKAMEGCDRVFHLAAYARPWSRDPELPFVTNVTGTRNVLEAALQNQIPRLVFTSSAGTMGPSKDGTLVAEETNTNPHYFNEYERTKALAEEVAREYAAKGLGAIIVNPSRVFGPGPMGVSNSVTGIIRDYFRGRWRVIPGNGCGVGNYVYVDDVVTGHLLAAEKGTPGQRYILGGDNVSFNEMFHLLGQLRTKPRTMLHISAGLLTGITAGMEFYAGITGRAPLITRGFLKKYLDNWSLSSEKAKRELGYQARSFEEGVKETIDWLKRNDEL